MLPLVKMMQQIALLIMLQAIDVESIRNAGSSSGSSSSIQNNYESFSPADAAQSSFFPAHRSTESAMEARQSTPFRPSQLLQFTSSDASDAALTQNYASYPTTSASSPQPQVVEKRFSQSQSQSQFAFPMEKQQQTTFVPANNLNNYNNNNYINNYNNKKYSSNTQQSFSSNAHPTQLPSTPILTYADPYASGNYKKGSVAGESGGVQDGQEYTVHSSIVVQTHGQVASAPAYQREPSTASSYQQPSYAAASRPTYTAPVPSSTFAHKHDDFRPYAPNAQHPNALPNYERELPAAATSTPAGRLSYASKDYPPPSYAAQNTVGNQSPPQRQDFSSGAANYVNNYSNKYSNNYSNNNYNNNNNNNNNYLNNPGNYGTQQQQTFATGYYQTPTPSSSYTSTRYPPVRPSYQPTRVGPPQSPQRPPTYNNYYNYQLGEIPPPTYAQAGYRPGAASPPPPYRPYAPQSVPQTSSLPSSLASLFTTTQQYAPQFTNLLLSGGNNNNPLTSLLGAFAGGGGGGNSGATTQSQSPIFPPRPLNGQLIKALENIARNDDLQCVPKVLCQMIAGQTQRGQLPTFATSPAITNFLAAIPTSSPALIYGRAALLGISGGAKSCHGTYSKCPKNEDEILYYLNNHRGGFFKLFSEPEQEPEQPQQSMLSQSSSSASSSGSNSLFGILSLLTGNPPPTTTTPRPRPKPTAAADITSSIGNFFSNLLSDYVSGVEYQRRRRRRRSLVTFKDDDDEQDDFDGELEQETDLEDFHDEEDNEDTQDNADDYKDTESRILHKDILAGMMKRLKFFPENIEKIRESVNAYNQEAASRKLKFPSSTEDREYELVTQMNKDRRRGKQLTSVEENAIENEAITHNIKFLDESEEENAHKVRFVEDVKENLSDSPPTRDHRMIFPTHYETHIRKGKILNRPTYAANFAGFADRDKLIVSNEKRETADEFSINSLGRLPNHYTNINNENRYSTRAPNHNYDYPNNNYLANNRYSSINYHKSHTTSRPREEDKNIYVTNAKGENEYYITTDGRKIYL